MQRESILLPSINLKSQEKAKQLLLLYSNAEVKSLLNHTKTCVYVTPSLIATSYKPLFHAETFNVIIKKQSDETV